ncbi:hypothetical protein [Pelotalea chapellei]|uniref:Uncharacterized protein n=1 Tax=Pelotalea chapellei TaxID=44671 RepID=A0ABS5U8S1_9BACT|nr:hypothetical protein [Pelotalea chapellei]MBT1072035.1 hypothetical protein [Pelotalea chapellei]
MIILLLVGMFSINSVVHAADDIQIGCNRLSLVLDPALSPSVVDREWATGESSSQAPAVLELRGCKGQILDRLTLDAALARLDPIPLRGAPAPSYLVSVDLTQAAGSYNGPLTFPVQVVNNHLQRVVALASNGRLEPIYLAQTGKADWRKIFIKGVDNLVSVSCQPKDKNFVTFYRRYHPTRNGWKVRMRSVPCLWESDGEFPEINRFP